MSGLKKRWLHLVGYRYYQYSGTVYALHHLDQFSARLVHNWDGRVQICNVGDWILMDLKGDEWVISDEEYQRDWHATNVAALGIWGDPAMIILPYHQDCIAKPFYVVEESEARLRWLIFIGDRREELSGSEFKLRYGSVEHKVRLGAWNSFIFNWDQTRLSTTKTATVIRLLTSIHQKIASWSSRRRTAVSSAFRRIHAHQIRLRSLPKRCWTRATSFVARNLPRKKGSS